jgi:GDP-L-fucose synthase
MMTTSSKIYVAGHQGLVGSALVRILSGNGYNNLVVRSFHELDLRNQHQVTKFFDEQRPEYVFLAAAKVGGIGANSTYKAEFMYDNMMIAAHVIHASYCHGVRKLINFGSSCIYPRLAPQPLKEEYLLSGPFEPTNEPYAIAKIAALKLCRYYNEQYGTNFISLMPTNLYGPYDNFNLEAAHVLPALIRKFHLAKLLMQGDYDAVREDFKRYPVGYGITAVDIFDPARITAILERCGIVDGAVTLWGSGTPCREFLHVDDAARAALLLAEHYDYYDVGECINVGTGTDCAICELADVIKHIVGFNGRVLYGTKVLDGMPRKRLNISKIEALNWKPSITLADGLKHVYSWYAHERSDEESCHHATL